MATLCTQFGEINLASGRMLTNNVWDLTGINTWTQCIHNTPLPWGYNWNIDSATDNVKSYPSIVYGRRPWRASSTIASMPVQISAINNFKVDLAGTTTVSSGKYNTAFDLWIVSAKPGTPNQVTAEVMIWLEDSAWVPAGTVIGTHTIDGRVYDLYKAQFADWVYYNFRAQVSGITGIYDIKKFLGVLTAAGEISASSYLGDVEFGNEIVNGVGSMSITKFNVTR